MPMPSACPNCGVVLDPAPQRTRKCPECKARIVVRTDRRTRDKLLLTVAQAEQFDSERKAQAARNKAMRSIEWLGVTDQQFDLREQELREHWGANPSPGDVFWSLANEMTSVLASAGEWHELSMLYMQMASHLHDEGRPHLELQGRAFEAQLRNLMRGSKWLPPDSGALIIANACCAACRKLDGRVLPFQEALQTMPLPPEDCERGWCNCTWSAHVGD